MNFLNRIKYCVKYRSNENDVSLQEAMEMLNNDKKAILLDVRSPQEYEEYHLEGATLLPLYELSSRINSLVKDKDTLLIVYCKSGARSKKAVAMLKKLGYTNVYNIKGGLDNN